MSTSNGKRARPRDAKRWCMAMALGVGALGAKAGVMTDMTQMFMSNASTTGVISTKDRVGVFGGSFELRDAVSNVNLVAFDPPRLDAGCGGVDLYGGSFSFINSQQLVQIFRQVAANAVGLAFKAAIKSISPSLSDLITEFQTLLQHMNTLAKNSCQMAHLVLDGVDSVLGTSLNSEGATNGVAKNAFTDEMDALTKYLHNKNDYFNTQAKTNPKAGNAVMKQIVASGSSAQMGSAGLPNFDGSGDDASNPNSLNNRLLISALGYDVVGVGCQNQNAAGTPDATSADSEMQVVCSGAKLIDLEDLVTGGGVGSTRPNVPLKLYRCIDPTGTPGAGVIDPQICTKMKAESFDYPGIAGYVYKALFGGALVTNAPTPDSIVGRLSAGGTLQLTPEQVTFIQQSGSPLIGMLAKTSDPSARQSIARSLSEQIINCMAAKVGESLYKGANGIQSGAPSWLSQDTKTNIQEIGHAYLDRRKTCLNLNRVAEVAQQLNAATNLMAGPSK